MQDFTDLQQQLFVCLKRIIIYNVCSNYYCPICRMKIINIIFEFVFGVLLCFFLLELLVHLNGKTLKCVFNQ